MTLSSPFVVDSLFYRALLCWSGINEHVSSRQGRTTHKKIFETIAVRNNVSSGRNCLRYISVSLTIKQRLGIRARRFQDTLSASRDVRFPRQGEISGRPGRRQTIFHYCIFSRVWQTPSHGSFILSLIFFPVDLRRSHDRHVGGFLAAH